MKVEDLESRQLVEPGHPGELLIRGPQVKKDTDGDKDKDIEKDNHKDGLLSLDNLESC